MVATAKIGKQKYHFQKKLRMNSQKIIITITQNALYLVSFHTNLTFSYMLNNWPTLSHKWHFFYKKICNKGLVWHEIEPLNSRCNRNKPSVIRMRQLHEIVTKVTFYFYPKQNTNISRILISNNFRSTCTSTEQYRVMKCLEEWSGPS